MKFKDREELEEQLDRYAKYLAACLIVQIVEIGSEDLRSVIAGALDTFAPEINSHMLNLLADMERYSWRFCEEEELAKPPGS